MGGGDGGKSHSHTLRANLQTQTQTQSPARNAWSATPHYRPIVQQYAWW